MPPTPNRARIFAKPEAIHNYCKDNDLSLRRLAARLGVGADTVYRVEAGNEPSPAFIAALMLETGQPFERLFVTLRSDEVRAS